MLRKIIDYKNLDPTLANLLIETYESGYGDDDIIMFKNAKGEMIEAVELKTPKIIYLVKISSQLSDFITNFEDNIEKELSLNEPEATNIKQNEEVPDLDVFGDSDFQEDFE